MKQPPAVCVSACLLGVACRYDGKSKPSEAVRKFCEPYRVIPICPEQLGGLPTPRTAGEIRNGRVITQDGTDRTEAFQKGAEAALQLAADHRCLFAILKERSPSCGKNCIYDGSFSKVLIPGSGITAGLFRDHGIPVFSEEELNQIPKP